MPSVTSFTCISVFLERSSVSRLWCFGSRCCTRTNAMPESTGRLHINSVKASIPPAEAPIAAINRSFFEADGTAPSSLAATRRGVRFVGSDFMALFAILQCGLSAAHGGVSLLELLSENCELLLQVGNFLLKCCDFLFEIGDALAVSSETGGGCFCLRFCIEGLHIARKEMRVARFLSAGLPGKNFDEWGLALHQVLQAGVHGAEIVEGVHTLGAGPEFAGRLRTAQEQDAENGDFVAIEVEGFLEAVFVLGDAAIRGTDGADEGLTVQRMQRLPDGRFVETHCGFAVRFLVASIDEGVQREWVIFGSGDLFFDEGAQDPAFDFV